VSQLKGEGKVIVLYFSAHWCPPCRGFTPELVKTVGKLKAAGKAFEIIFVSSDRDQKSFQEYFGSMGPHFLAIPQGDPRKAKLSSFFGVEGIPTLVTVDGATGATINGNARGACGGDPDGLAFPWAPKPVVDFADGCDGINDTLSLCLLLEGCGLEVQQAAIAAATPLAEAGTEEKPAPKRAPPKRAPAPRPVARSSGGSGVTSQMGFGGYVKQSRVPSYSGQSFQAGDLGVLPPLGVWDPLGLIKTRDMRRYEEMEIKQGRIAMLATVHVIVTEAGIRWPGNIADGSLTGGEPIAFADIPAGTLASWKAVPALGWFQLVFLFAVLDQQIFPQDPNKAPGDVGGDNWVRYSNDEQRTFKLNVERQNGRAAMLGITGMMIHEGLGVDALYPTGGMEGLAPPAIFG